MSLVFANFLYRMEEMINKQYEISSTIRHKGEKGRQREDGLAQFLKDNLPDRYGVGTGEIFSSEGNEVSPQCDVIIYDRLNMPIIGKSNSVQQVPIEAVYSVIEIKSLLDTASLVDAERKFSRIRNLPRYKPKTRLQKNKVRGPAFMLFGYKLKTKTDLCTSFVKANAVNEDVSVYALDTGGTIYIGDQGSSDIRVIFLRTTAERPGKLSMHFTLGLLFVDLLESLERIDLGKVDFTGMLKPVSYNVDEVINLSLQE
jgi:hypothetical protein